MKFNDVAKRNSFGQKLVLNSYIFSLLGVKDLEELSKSFKDDKDNYIKMMFDKIL
ncbi:MAG: hypothetical protein KAJ49_09265 [Arcobacteraceae bacterium]|nr:hypothetical protein [Arcobacteraceae bacterium]